MAKRILDEDQMGKDPEATPYSQKSMSFLNYSVPLFCIYLFFRLSGLSVSSQLILFFVLIGVLVLSLTGITYSVLSFRHEEPNSFQKIAATIGNFLIFVFALFFAFV